MTTASHSTPNLSPAPTPQSRVQRIGNWLAWLGGATDASLRDAPHARGQFVQMGLVLLTTASLAVLSMSFALHDGVKTAWIFALPLAVLWGFVILNLDRFLVLSMSTTRDWRRLLAMAVPRVLMAAVLAVVISTPLVLRVFESDIKAEMYVYKLEQSKNQAAKEQESKEQKEVDDLRKQISAHEQAIAGKLPYEATSPRLASADKDVSTAERKLNSLRRSRDARYAAWQCELYGAGPKCKSASRKRGAGPLAEAKRREYYDAKAQVAAAEGRLAAANRDRDSAKSSADADGATALENAQAEARTELPNLRARLAAVLAVIKTRTDQGAALNAADDGILAQIRALQRVGARDSGLEIAHLLVAALFFLIEILPVAVKVLLSFGEPSVYESAARLRDEEILDRLKLRRAETRRIEEGKSNARVHIEQHMRELEQGLGEQANERVAEELSTIIETALNDWSEQLEDDLAAASGNGAGSGYAGPGPGYAGASSHGQGGAGYTGPGPGAGWEEKVNRDRRGRPGGAGPNQSVPPAAATSDDATDGYSLPDAGRI